MTLIAFGFVACAKPVKQTAAVDVDYWTCAMHPLVHANGPGKCPICTDGDGSRWTAFFFKWAAGPPRSRILAQMHRPENCLPGAGYKLRMDRGTITINAKELSIPFHALEFDDNGQPLYAFYCLRQDRWEAGEPLRIGDFWDNRLVGRESVLLGERNLGQQTLEILIFGYALRRQMGNFIKT